MSQIYKLNHIQGDETIHIYIFSNDNSIGAPEYIDSENKPVFTAQELQNIHKRKKKA